MDREILFRGKTIDETCLNGEWLEGDILHDGVTGKYYINRNNCLNESDRAGEEGLLQFVAYEVDPSTICQYTGLTDRNGSKIFEGDIVDCREKRGAAFWHCKVVWNDVKARFDVIAMDCAFPMCLDDVSCAVSVDGPDYEVTGNVFDNPDLMEEN